MARTQRRTASLLFLVIGIIAAVLLVANIALAFVDHNTGAVALRIVGNVLVALAAFLSYFNLRRAATTTARTGAAGASEPQPRK